MSQLSRHYEKDQMPITIVKRGGAEYDKGAALSQMDGQATCHHDFHHP